MKMDAALNDLLEQGSAAAPEDHINPDDGLLYCGKCRTPKEAFFDENRRHGDFIKHTVLCKCAGEEAERKAAEEKKWKRQNYLQNLRAEAFSDIPAYTWRFESAAVLTPQLQKVKAYADRWEEFSRENIGLLLFGNVGTGKSYAAGCVANALLDRGISVRFIGLADAVNRMQGVMGEERERCIKYLMSRKKPDDVIQIDLDLASLPITSVEASATYEKLRDYVRDTTGLKVSSLNVSQVKRKLGLEVGENHNPPKSDNTRVPQCPPEKEKAIIDALEHFKMLPQDG